MAMASDNLMSCTKLMKKPIHVGERLGVSVFQDPSAACHSEAGHWG